MQKVGCGLDGLRFESREAQEIFLFARTSINPPVHGLPGYFLGGKTVGGMRLEKKKNSTLVRVLPDPMHLGLKTGPLCPRCPV